MTQPDRPWEVTQSREVPDWEHEVLERFARSLMIRPVDAPEPTFPTHYFPEGQGDPA